MPALVRAALAGAGFVGIFHAGISVLILGKTAEFPEKTSILTTWMHLFFSGGVLAYVLSLVGGSKSLDFSPDSLPGYVLPLFMGGVLFRKAHREVQS